MHGNNVGVRIAGRLVVYGKAKVLNRGEANNSVEGLRIRNSSTVVATSRRLGWVNA